ncbi:nucleotide-sugar transporter-domain-containing protein [Gigaspora rosea]|uniref:Nucleotide-sugar transporter-domain-containing protein n=1 Tax=Gigaspora rosea TaxID=44941 RepID=A0A397UQL1_9GLOM|nr:nucleotide-sugar transporter-domain-containing protein [Gigaspora rosea]
MFGIPLKYVSLIILCVQNSTLVIVMRYSRMVPESELYSTATAVFLSEVTKFIICIYMAIRSQVIESGHWKASELYDQVFSADAWKLMIPAALYTVQNNLQYIAVSTLDAATFQVTYQLKILTTAICSVLMLKTSLSPIKWFSLVLLTCGVALVQLKVGGNNSSHQDDKVIQTNQSFEKETFDDNGAKKLVGLCAVSVACVISGLAGVYFEKVLKGSQPSLWIRNLQLSFFSLFPALILGVWWKDGSDVWEKGFFHGYNLIVLSAIACQAIGGIIVALVVKYADNILKGFATSISIILSFIASVYLFNFPVTGTFLIGSTLVLIATYMYNYHPIEQEEDNVGQDSSVNEKVDINNGFVKVSGKD